MPRRRLFLYGGIVLVLAAGAVFALLQTRQRIVEAPTSTIDDEPHVEKPIGPRSPLTGTHCIHAERRPVAVMMAADPATRPLSGIALADIVVEMPVITNRITRFMGIFQCDDVAEIGSVRSARHDFIPFAAAFGAVYAHWGGSVLALNQLRDGVIDNVDALVNPGSAFYRKRGIVAPHDGFTSTERLLRSTAFLGYRTTMPAISSLLFQEHERVPTPGTLNIGYPGAYRVSFSYDPTSGLYTRSRAALPEYDRLTGDVVQVTNVVVMQADSRQVLDEYNDVTLEGTGRAWIYRSGEEIVGWWKKPERPLDAPLQFVNDDGMPISFSPGRTWISIVQPNQEVQWTTR